MNKGIVSTGSNEATQAGAEILRAGGNAFDAAVSAVFTSMTSEFALTGAGGGGHMLLYCEKSKQARVVKKMKSYGIHEVKFNFYNEGAKIFNLYDYK